MAILADTRRLLLDELCRCAHLCRLSSAGQIVPHGTKGSSVLITTSLLTEARTATGIVADVEQYLTAEQRAALPDGAARPRATDDQGRYLVDIECLMPTEEFGRPKTEIIRVRVPDAPEARAIQPGPVRFRGLAVEVRPVKGGGVRYYWSADGIDAGKRGE